MARSYGYGGGKKKIVVVILILLGLAAVACGVYAVIYNMNAAREDAVIGMKGEIGSNISRSHVQQLSAYQDYDSDGSKNSVENTKKTNVVLEDTDGDGLIDSLEDTYGTDPMSSDTDGDGVLDGYEIKAGLDPLAIKTNGTDKDDSVVFVNKLAKGELSVEISGDANCYDSSINTANIVALTSNPYIVSEIYDITCRHTFDSAKLTFKLDEERLNNLELNKSQLTIYNYNTVSKVLEPVESTVSGDLISAEVSHFSIYCVGVKSLATEAMSTQILFVIDNSGSMYPEEMCYDSEENDVNFKRLDMVQGIIDNLGTEEYSYRVAKFTARFDSMHSDAAFSGNTEELSAMLERIRTEDPMFDGTDISNAIDNAIREFNASGADGHRIIVLLTDGDGTEPDPYTADEITDIVRKSGAVLLTIGLGKQVDALYLSDMAEGTGGMYYTAGSADSLSRVCSDISAMLSDAVVLPEGTLTGEDATNYMDGYVVADCGFDIVDGFSFADYATVNSNSSSFGMAAFAEQYYSRTLTPVVQADAETAGYNITSAPLWIAYTQNKPLSEYAVSVFPAGYENRAQSIDFGNIGSVLKINSAARSAAEANGLYFRTMTFNKKYLDACTSWEMLAVPVEANGEIISSAFAEKFPSESAVFSAIEIMGKNVENKKGYRVVTSANGEKGFENVIDAVRNGHPVITVLTERCGDYQVSLNAVNIMKIIKSPDNDYDYYLCVYDSKKPAEEQWIKLKMTRRAEKNVNNSDYILSADYSNGIISCTGAGIEFYISK